MSTLLVTLGDWEVRDSELKEHTLRYYATHKPCNKRIEGSHLPELAWFSTDDTALCYHCEAAVPVGVQAVVILLEK